jgi:RecA-family ATPase
MFNDQYSEQALSDLGANNQNAEQDSKSFDTTPSETLRRPAVRRWGQTNEPPQLEWLVDQLIQKNALNTIAGEPGVGKTRMAAHIAVRVATGEPFLSHKVTQGPVLYLDFDDNETLPRNWVERVANGINAKFDDLPLYYWTPSQGVDTSHGITKQ